eukprot:3026962-Amphidinium_carterae.1
MSATVATRNASFSSEECFFDFPSELRYSWRVLVVCLLMFYKKKTQSADVSARHFNMPPFKSMTVIASWSRKGIGSSAGEAPCSDLCCVDYGPYTI